MKSLFSIIILTFFILSLNGCYTQIGVKDENDNGTGYSSSAQPAAYNDQGSYYGYEDYSLGCSERTGFSYYYPPFFPSEEFSFTSASMWTPDYYGGYPSMYGGGGYMSYGSSYYHSPYFHYPPAYARYGYSYEPASPPSQNNANSSPVDATQGSRDIGNTRLDIPTGNTMDLPRGAILQGSPRVVAPSTPTQTSTDNTRNTGTQRTTTSPQKSGKRGSGSRANARGTYKTKTVSLPATPPNIKMPDQSVNNSPATTTPVTPAQNGAQKTTTTTQTPPPQNNSTNSNERKTGSSRGGPP